MVRAAQELRESVLAATLRPRSVLVRSVLVRSVLVRSVLVRSVRAPRSAIPLGLNPGRREPTGFMS